MQQDKGRLRAKCVEAVKTIYEACILLFATGAGLSGLAVFADVGDIPAERQLNVVSFMAFGGMHSIRIGRPKFMLYLR